ncbi:hypothetical protein [Rhodococcus opacus]|uniref:Acetyl-CoA acetyltransferase n=1 Tax=Rhodococcus opacus (strain B4) TaxID=632772 RepID=C1BB48_RHOOB|nr:hypothetical protein [Rhodococcus opacus]BAH52901.1 hypothetical protein ROP_46540 [Rhodococcus opacus B4]
MTVTGSAGGRAAPVAVVGLACTPFVPEHDAVLDELVYDVVSRALGEAALRKQDIGLTVTASMDIYDGRSISSGLTNSASGGYLQDSYRLESDSGTAILAAAEAISSGDVEVAVAVGVYNPESTSRGAQRRTFLEQISNLAFDPHFARPVGLTAEATYALHTAWALEHDVEITELADLAAVEITKSVGHFRSVRRDRVTGADVLSADPANGALTELMLPAHGTGAVAVVLASPARAARLQGRNAVITGFGRGTGGYVHGTEWLTDVGASTRHAATTAYRNAGITTPAEEIDLLEFTAPTASMYRPLLDALALDGLAADRINRWGSTAGVYPGVANGAVRLADALDRLAEAEAQTTAVVHSVDTVTGAVALDSTVLVVQGV